MSQEAVSAIRETEKKAADIRGDATERARQMTAKARADGEQKCVSTEKATREEIRNNISQMRKRADELIARNRADAENEAGEMRENADKKRGEAATLIIQRLVEKCQ